MTALFIIARIIFGGYFIYNSYNHYTHIPNMAAYAASKGVPSAKLSIFITATLLLLGGASILLGLKPVVGIVLLLIFLVPTTFIMHAFWADKDSGTRMSNRINFGKNLALIGACIMLLMIPRPWPAGLM